MDMGANSKISSNLPEQKNSSGRQSDNIDDSGFAHSSFESSRPKDYITHVKVVLTFKILDAIQICELSGIWGINPCKNVCRLG